MSKQKYMILENENKIVDIPNKNQVTVYGIIALKDFYDVNGNLIKKGTKGGYIDKDSVLSQEGKCWIAEDSVVVRASTIADDAFVSNSLIVTSIVENQAQIINSQVTGSLVCGEVIKSMVNNSKVEKTGVVINSTIDKQAVIGECVENTSDAVTIADSKIASTEILGNSLVTNSTIKSAVGYSLTNSRIESSKLITTLKKGCEAINLRNYSYIENENK